METIGSLIDKMSINELKIYHMEEQKSRTDINEAFRRECEEKLSILYEQRYDMKQELQEYIDDVKSGKRKIKVYRQMKMYNDKRYKIPDNTTARK